MTLSHCSLAALEQGVMLGRVDPSRCSGAVQEVPVSTRSPAAGSQGKGPFCGQIQCVLLLGTVGRKDAEIYPC